MKNNTSPFQLIPIRYRRLWIFAIVSPLILNLLMIISALVRGKELSVFGCPRTEVLKNYCHTIIPKNAVEFGEFTATTVIGIVGGLIIYWWEYIRKPKEPVD